MSSTADIIQQTLADLNIDATLEVANENARLNQYIFKLSSETKLDEAKALEKEISAALSCYATVRIAVFDRSKGLISVEVPKDKPEIIELRDLLNSKEWQDKREPGRFIYGVDLQNKLVTQKVGHSLRDGGHTSFLISGTTGSGRYVLLKTILVSLLACSIPEELQLLLIDTKQTQFSEFANIPHLIRPIIADNADDALDALRTVNDEMGKRYQTLADTGSRTTADYNSKHPDNIMSRLVIMIDDFELFMRTDKERFKDIIIRILQKGAGVSIHVFLSTMIATEKNIPGIIRANIEDFVALHLSSEDESKLIIGEAGTENLLGKGDVLLHSSGRQTLIRLQAPMVSNKESEEFCKTLS